MLAAAYDLKTFFTVVAKPPDQVRPADVLAFITAQRTGRAGERRVLQSAEPRACRGVRCHGAPALVGRVGFLRVLAGPRRCGSQSGAAGAHPEDRSLSSTGITNPLIAEAVARGDAPASKPPVLATNDEELAARQVAIWSSTNNIPLTPRTVPNAVLRRRARQLLAGSTVFRSPSKRLTIRFKSSSGTPRQTRFSSP